MSFRLSSLVAIVAAALAFGCERRDSSLSTPSDQSALTVVNPVHLAAKGGGDGRTITMSDACDPETFNAALGPGMCVRNGGVRFDKFLEQLGKHQKVGSWHFAPGQATIQLGQQLVAANHGGETHTFTEVAAFAGGIVSSLNDLMGLATVAPECQQLQPTDFVPAGGSTSHVEDEAGVELYQCCLHPWMRAEIRVIDR